MKKKRSEKKSNRGRKPNLAGLSGIKPEEETWDEIRCRVHFGSNEWAMVGLRQSIKKGAKLMDNPFWNTLCAEFERAVLNGDFGWFRRQANAIENAIKKGGLTPRAQFNAKVVYLLEQAMSEPLGLQENWRRLTDAEREAFPNLRRVPEVVTLTPAGKSTDATARNIYNALTKTNEKGEPYDESKDSVLVVEGYQFDSKERVMDAIHELAKRLLFALKKTASETLN